MNIIRKIGKFFFIVILVIISILMIAFVVFHSSGVQQYLTGKLTNYMKKEYNILLTIDGVDISLFNKVILENVYIEDQKKDTLIYIRELRTYIDQISISKRRIALQKIEFKKLKFLLLVDSISTNLDFLIDAFSSKDTIKKEPSGQSWDIACRNIAISNGKVALKEVNAVPQPFGMNVQDLEFNNINLEIEKLSLADTVKFMLKNLNFVEKNSFRVLTFSTFARINKHRIMLDSLAFKTQNSDIFTDHFYLGFDSWDDFNDFTRKIRFDIELLSPSTVGFSDLAFLAPDLYGMDQRIAVQGKVTGRVNHLKSENFRINFGDRTRLITYIEIDGLPNIDETNFHLNAKYLTTTKRDLESIYIPPFNKKRKLKLPSYISKLGDIRYKGVFTGMLDDFVIKGEFRTDLGNISPFMQLKPDTTTHQTDFVGTLNMDSFQLGKFLDLEKIIGKVSFHLKVNGKQAVNAPLKADITGMINSIDVYKYTYRNFFIEGKYDTERLTFFCDINDQNFKFNIDGKLDSLKSVPVLDLKANLAGANLYKLNIDTVNENSLLKFNFDAFLKGDKLGNLIGKATMNDGKWHKGKETIPIKNITLIFDSLKTGEHTILASTDYFDARIKGVYSFETIGTSFQNLMYRYLPVFKQDEYKPKPKSDYIYNNFTFNIDFKNTQIITQNLLPDFNISESTQIQGTYNEKANYLEVELKSPNITFYQQNFKNFKCKLQGIDSLFSLDLSSNDYTIVNNYHLQNFLLTSKIQNNVTPIAITWDNGQAEDRYQGEVNTQITFLKNLEGKMPLIQAEIFPREFIISNRKWKMQNSQVLIDTTAIDFRNFEFSNDEQFIQVMGKITENPSDTLFINAGKISTENLNIILEKYGFNISGLLYGRNKIANIYQSPKLYINDSIVDFTVNKTYMGTLNINSTYKPEEKKIFAHTYIKNKKNVRNLDISGHYFPEQEKLDFRIKMDRFIINFLNNFTEGNLSNVIGMASADSLKVQGTLSQPLIDGRIIIQKGGFKVDYLKTAYSFTDSVEITPTSFKINKLKITDERGDSALVSGKLTHNNFGNIRFDLSINAKKFLFLNTTQEDNDLYYGKAYATGKVNIAGTLDNMTIDVNAKTEKNTLFFIPLTSVSEVSENNFITFVSRDSVLSKMATAEDYKVDLSGITLNFNLEVTPDAEAQIIMDETVGDIIRGRGNGQLNMKIDTKGDFNMQGTFTIDKGDYLFTLKNVVNKKFDVEKGGTITWTGDPYNADINLNAIYRLKKVSLYDLLLEDEYKETKVPVNCNILMTEKLMKPAIKFGIEVQEKDDRVSSQLSNLPTDEMNKQFLSLLVINRFQPLPGMKAGLEAKSANIGGISNNASELLTNQLNHWLSQISKDFDIGVNYRASDSVSTAEVEVALSTQLLNDRITVNGNVSMGGNTTTSNAFVGEFDVEYKITKSGKLRVKYFNKANDNLNYDASSPYKQGLGLFYKKDFNTFNDIFKRDEPADKKPKKQKEKPKAIINDKKKTVEKIEAVEKK